MEPANCWVFPPNLDDLLLLSCTGAVKTGLQLVSGKFGYPVTAVHGGDPRPASLEQRWWLGKNILSVVLLGY